MKRSDAAALLVFLVLVLTFFAPVLLGSATLLPFDNLYRFPPWQSFAASFGATQPHNPLLDDLVLENYPWKKFIVDSLRQGELPLWNPYILSGQPFLAAGQNAALYPLGALFYLVPLARAYGLFVALHLWIAAAAMYLLARVLRLRPFAATLCGIVYAFSGFMVVSVVFPMVVSAAAWLPGILALVELTLREEEKRLAGAADFSTPRELVFALLSAVLLGLQFLAGHVEMSYYILLVVTFYAAWRIAALRPGRLSCRADSPRPPPARDSILRRLASTLRARLRAVVVFGGIMALGSALAAIQLIPLYELVQRNFRAGSVSYAQVAGWALPLRQVVTFLVPDFFGNPTHHSYLDVFDWITKPAPTGTIFWGIKNYVEAGSYVGLAPLALALVAVGATIASYLSRIKSWRLGVESSNPSPGDPYTPPPPYSPTLFFTVLAVLSLLFAFGTPLYAVLFYGLPGYNQLHTAFRWIFPYTLSTAFLAGAGCQMLPALVARKGLGWGLRALAWSLLVVGTTVLAALGLSLAWHAPFLQLADWLLAHSDLARATFDGAQMFWSYEFRNALLFGVFLFGAGEILAVAHTGLRLPRRLGGHPLWQPLALAVVVLDLFIFGAGFNPASDPRLADFTPPAIRFLQDDHSLFRIASYDLPDQKVLNPNAGMYFGLSDIRGYDSIIPRQYAEFMGALAPQDELLYNRIAPFYNYVPLGSRLLDLLNVKYVLTTRPVPNPGYKLVYDREIKIYENENALPRAFLVPTGHSARVIQDESASLAALPALDPRSEVLFDREVPPPAPQSLPPTVPGTAEIVKYSGSEVIVKTSAGDENYLVLADSYFPGWIAQLDGADTPLYRADYNFRAVVVPAGEHEIRFKYSPLSFKVGGITSLVAALLVLLGLVALGWRQFAFAEPSGEGSQVRVVAKNSLVPMAAALLSQGLNFAFALVMLRILGPTNAGSYAFAVTVWFFLNSITDFGLGILMTREVSRERTLANRYLTNTAVLRMLLTVVSLAPLALLIFVYSRWFDLTGDTAVAILLLWLGLIPANLAASLSYLFNAYERFEYPTAVSLATALLSVSLQVVALLSGFGIVGLAAVSILSNLFTLGVMFYLVRTTLFVPRWEFDRALMRWMFFESYPLMLNNLLANLFFRIDVFLLKPLTNDTILGYYSTAYKFINALNFIPSNFTLAIFPLLSRYSTSAKDAMLRALVLSLKLLLWLSLPITVATVFVAHQVIEFYGGAAYLPDSAIALQWLIWFLPFSFVNSVVHYVLIALNQQRFLTKAFLIGLAFNLAANLIAIPPLSYRGAALVTVFSEMALLLPFYYSLRRHLAPLPILDLLWRPAAASALMGGALYVLLPRVNFWLALAVAALLYAAALLLFGALGPDERLLLRRLVPSRFGRALAIVLGLVPG